jgi:hypothetical protein
MEFSGQFLLHGLERGCGDFAASVVVEGQKNLNEVHGFNRECDISDLGCEFDCRGHRSRPVKQPEAFKEFGRLCERSGELLRKRPGPPESGRVHRNRQNEKETTTTLTSAAGGMAMVLMTVIATAQPVQFQGNGNHYAFVPSSESWLDAQDAAASMSFHGVSGHLVTITSQAENDFLVTLTANPDQGDTDLDGVGDPCESTSLK